ncbi:MAG: TonB-dependent receptor [Flavisolibacter sp.]|nr:TonB-dependent receptor [Flavisolibacter sp.]
MRVLSFLLFILLPSLLCSQTLVQTIYGTVIDRDSRTPLAGASISVVELSRPINAVSDSLGKFEIQNVPVGRIKLITSYVGYLNYTTDYILLNTAKELQLSIEMEENKNSQENVTVHAVRNPKLPVNRYSLAGARSFTAEETQRYAASANDPGRMAMAFPGVQATRDTRSDIIIRGNNPVNMQWRLEGVDIVNPNHFARKGSTGGGITILSLAMLDNSDFLTGAMPAEYGDVISGVFDMHLRKGNNLNRENTFKAGMIGIDYATEGPIKKGQSSYLANYRYSTLGLLELIGFNLVSERESNTFQDLSFNLAFNNKTNRSQWNVWGMGGISKETYAAVENVNEWKQYDDYAIYDFRTKMGAIGVGNILKINEKSFMRSSLVYLNQRLTFVDDTLNAQLHPSTVNDERYTNSRLSFATSYNYKFGASANFKAGTYITDMMYDFRSDKLNFNTHQIETITDGQGNTWLFQPYVQASIKPGTNWVINPGIHIMHLALNNKTTLDPRLSIQFRFNNKQNITAAYGLYSKVLPLGSYFYKQGSNYPNKDLDMMRSHHYVLAYDHLLGNSWRLHSEIYYQQLFQVPVVNDVNRTYWMLNELDGYADEALISKGKGINKGIDVSVEKFFSKGFFMITSFSVFNSTFQPLNGKNYDTRFNASTAGSWTGAKEINLKNNKVLQLGWKTIYNGGFRLTPLQAGASYTTREPVLDENKPFSEKISPYFRTDGRISLRKDKTKNAWQLALDIQNVFGIKNTDGLARRYDPSVNQWVYEKQSGLVPLLSYQIDF